MTCRNQVVALLPKNPPKQNSPERSAQEVQPTEQTEADGVKVVEQFYVARFIISNVHISFVCLYLCLPFKFFCFLIKYLSKEFFFKGGGSGGGERNVGGDLREDGWRVEGAESAGGDPEWY